MDLGQVGSIFIAAVVIILILKTIRIVDIREFWTISKNSHARTSFCYSDLSKHF